ncbi:MAG: molybdopterin-dependent oxidoreductase, partial [Anaerolineales bacterium]|nr:molybdopterin-dependent oxidoreductase [Anaerolineales bacterium]
MWQQYYVASSVDDALQTLRDWRGKARLIAGGTDLVIDARSKKYKFECAVDTTRIPDLDSITETDEHIVVGANVTFHNLWTSPLINRTSHVLAEAAHNLAAWSIQNVATLVGNVVTAQPAGDGSIALVALGAEAEVANPDGQRWVAVSSLYAGPGKSRLDPSREMITRFRWRKPGPRQASACERIAKGEVVALPIASCGVELQLAEDLEHIAWARMALGPVALTPYRASCVEDLLRGARIDDDLFTQAAEQAVYACNMRTSRLRATKEYREELIQVLVRRALKRAVEAARTGGQPSVAGRLCWNRYWSGADADQPRHGEVTFTLNGRETSLKTEPGEMLVNLLREELGLTGTKIGCDEGECGACTVLIDGQPVLSCLYPAYKVQGRRVQTIEGVADGDDLHPVQAAFVSHDAVQCGYCTPGMVMTAISILDDIPDPSTEEIREGLGNNYCRCTGYVKIVDAIQDAAAVIRGDKESLTQIELPRKDAVDRVTGKEMYGSDLKLDNMLYGKVVWSGVAHAEIMGIDTAAAEATPGVVRVITHKDIPGKNIFGSMGYDQPALAEGRVLFAGEAVAVVYAETKEAADAGASKVKVTYRELPGVFTPQEALKEGAPILKGESNIFHQTLVEKGDINAGFELADIIIEDDYQTQTIEHLYLETEGGIGVMDDGVVTVYQATQWPPGDQMQLADILGIPKEKVRVVQTPIGGAFGGKMDLTTHPYLALGAYLTGRPVKVVLTRPESMRMHVKRHPFFLHYKLGATREGKIVALQAQIVSDGGAYRSTTDDVLEQATVFSSGPYAIPNVRLTGVSARTNNVPCGAMRGFGAQQVTFAMESQVDRLALALGMDPFELRRKNMLDVDSTLVTGQILKHSIGAKPVLDAAEKALKKMILPEPKPGKRIGIGVAAGMKNVGLGIGNDDSVHVSLELEPDGKILLRQGAIDLGQGSNSAMCQIVAKAMGID